MAQLVARSAGGREVAGSSPVTPTIVFMLYKSVDLGFDRGMKMKYLLLILILVGYGAYLQIMSSAVDAQLANLKHMYSDIPAQIVSSN